jgi:hypothetical protein
MIDLYTDQSPAMRRTGVRRLLALLKKVAKGVAVLVLLVTFFMDLPGHFDLILWVAACAGSWLLFSDSDTSGPGEDGPAKSDRDAYAGCLALQQKIQTLARRIEEVDTSFHLNTPLRRIERILQSMAEDGKYQASFSLFELMETTGDLLSAYLKVIQRGVDGPDARVRVRENLATLESAYELFWERLNRDAVVNFEALNEAIEFNLSGGATMRRLGDIG